MTAGTALMMNRIGMLLGFISFWLAAPELIGEPRLKEWQKALAGSASVLPRVAERTFGIVGTIFTLAYFAQMSFALSRVGRGSFHLEPRGIVETIGLVSWSILLAGRPLKAVIARLAADGDFRQRVLAAGGLLFTASFLLQFVATFQT